jgi:lipopolysaccharide/colanic/teichoic acid biosynthesis glycosyltransferase
MIEENYKPWIAVVSDDKDLELQIQQVLEADYELRFFSNGIILYNELKLQKVKYTFILSISDLNGLHGLQLKQTIDSLGFSDIPFFLITHTINKKVVRECISHGVIDIFPIPLQPKALKFRLDFFLKYPGTSGERPEAPVLEEFKMPLPKRLFDIVASGLALLLLSPLFLMVAIAIRLESPGPVFYYSYRVGTGYNIFKFYKFRSMFTGADARLKDLKHLNQYVTDKEQVTANPVEVKDLCELCEQAGGGCMQPIYDDTNVYCEKLYGAGGKSNKESAFIKILDDPRVTKVGKFIRNTSIDELPQLWNVLIGDMSLVGNRPLPLYEAEKITTDKYALRFLGPAGITGLWQVEKRGRGAMSEEERLSLDNDYVKNFNLLFDIKIILRTIPALFQSENV